MARPALILSVFALTIAPRPCRAPPRRAAEGLIQATGHDGTPAEPVAHAQQLAGAQRSYLLLAQSGVARAEQRWSDRRRGWYDARLGDRDRYPLATIWDIVPLFESLDAIAIAEPTPANRRAVARFASGAERYLNHGLRPVPGFSPYPGDRAANTADVVRRQRLVGPRVRERLPRDRHAALARPTPSGRSHTSPPSAGIRHGGGIWWNTSHPYKAGEALASGTLLATLLYQQTHVGCATSNTARKFLAWANTAGFSASNGLYAGSNLNADADRLHRGAADLRAGGPLPADRGSGRLRTRRRSSRRPRSTASATCSTSPRSTTPSTCSGCWPCTRSTTTRTLYALAADNARDAQTRARQRRRPVPALLERRNAARLGTPLPGMLQTQAATTSLFAWLAVYPPPS